jgi:hypothetical protein
MLLQLRRLRRRQGRDPSVIIWYVEMRKWQVDMRYLRYGIDNRPNSA